MSYNNETINTDTYYLNLREFNNTRVKEEPLHDNDGIRLSILYNHAFNESLPRITAVTLSSEETWKNKNSIVKIETKTNPATNSSVFEPFVTRLAKIGSNYQIKKIISRFDQETESEELTLTTINSHRLHAFATLINLYQSPEAKTLLIKALEKIVSWSIDDKFNDAKQEEIIYFANIKEQQEAIDNILSIQDIFYSSYNFYNDMCHNSTYTLLSPQEQKILSISIPSPKKLQTSLIHMREVLIHQEIETLLKEADDISNNDTIKSIPENIEKCRQFLNDKYPEAKPVLNQTFSVIKESFINMNNKNHYYNGIKDNVGYGAKVTKIFTGIAGTTFGMAKYAEQMSSLGYIGQWLQTLDEITPPAVKFSIYVATALSYLTSFTVLHLPDKKSVTVDDKALEEFSCRVVLCNIEKFINLDISGQKALANFYGKYLYNTLYLHHDQYQNDESITDLLLLNLHNETYLNDHLNMGRDLKASLTFKESSNSTDNINNIWDYIHHSESQCCGEIAFSDDLTAIASTV